MAFRSLDAEHPVKDVPDPVHAALRRRAALAGQSLQEYVLGHLTEEALAPTLDEVLDRAGGRLDVVLLTADTRLTAAPQVR